MWIPQYKKVLEKMCVEVLKVVRRGVSEVEKECFRSQEGLVERQSEVRREGTGGNPRCKGNCDEGTEGDRKREGEFIVRCILSTEKKN